MSEHPQKKLRRFKITGSSGLRSGEREFRKNPESEVIPFAKNTSYVEVAETVLQDKDGPWVNPLFLYISTHQTTVGVKKLCRQTLEYLEMQKQEAPMDILSVSAGIEGNHLSMAVLIRAYGEEPSLNELSDFLGEKNWEDDTSEAKLLVPEDVKRSFTEEERRAHAEAVKHQRDAWRSSTKEQPFLNQLDAYVPLKLQEIDDRQEQIYDLRTRDMKTSTMLTYEEFVAVFQQCMNYITTVEKDAYYSVLAGRTPKQDFWDVIDAYIQKNFIAPKALPIEDLPALKAKIERALFELYIVQDLIDDPEITDVKIADPFAIRVRIKGKAYLSNISFIDGHDFVRFVTGLAVRNNIDLSVPSQTFTDESDSNYLLRFTITAPYITPSNYPIIHIRKVPRDKYMADDLIRAGMMDEKIRDYLIDRGKQSRGVVFAGMPGSGKTTMLNWFFEEAYESSAEILVIQENDELFAYRKGVMFERVVLHPQAGQKPCSLEDLGQLALVSGANVLIIGEAKGAEICSAITLSNTGCRSAITIHSYSARQTIEQMTDLAMRGYPNLSYDHIKRMLKSFQTIVYLEDFSVKEIIEIEGYDEEKHDMIVRPIYRKLVGEKNA